MLSGSAQGLLEPQCGSVEPAGGLRYLKLRMQNPPSSLRRQKAASLTVAVMAFCAALLGWSASRQSPTLNETSHLVAGVSHWQLGAFDLYRVNPPLVRMVATIPVVLAGPKTDWFLYSRYPGVRSETSCQEQFVELNKGRVFWYLTLGRWMCIPFSLLGCYVCFRWASALYGATCGLVAATLWCTSPQTFAYGQLITADLGAAVLGLLATYGFWRWLSEPNWRRAASSGALLGLALLTKMSLIVLFALYPFLWIASRRTSKHQVTKQAFSEACQLALVLLLAILAVNLGYGFEGSFRPLGEFGFVSDSLGGERDGSLTVPIVRNGFRGTWLASVPVPLPENYVMGIDLQRWDFERKMWSYLRGEWRKGGWWYYYLYALAIKVPLGTWMLVFLAAGLGLFARGYTAGWRNELMLLAPVVMILTLVSSQTGFNHHMRYVLPIFPFAFIWISKVARAFDFGHRRLAAVVVVSMAWSIGSSLWVYPHSLSYFNELVGGPKNGHAHLLNSNIDWGQDLLYLKRWLDEHPEAQPLRLAFYGSYDASIAGIEYTLPPTEPQPGWHALSVNKIRSRTKEYEYFLRFEPVAMAGYSIYIYHITLDEANRVRRELGLPALPDAKPVK